MRETHRNRRLTSLAALAGYGAIAFLYLGLRLLIEPGRQWVGYGTDPEIFIWSFGWWPHAILHGQNPFVTHAIWAPQGVNLTWATSVPGLALLFAPVTLLAGPIAAYNVAAVLMPALAAWTAFLLCRRLTGMLWPSLVGGYLFGFSSYVLGQGEGHPHATAVFLIPLVALVVLRYLDGELGGRGTALRLGPLFAFELLFSTEITFTFGLALAVALVLGYALVPARRRRIVALLPPLAGAVGIATVLTAPFLYYALSDIQTGAFHPPADYGADLLNFAVPTRLALSSLGWAHSIATSFPANDSERGAYLGIPTLVILALFARGRLRSAGGRFLLACFGVAALAALGGALTVDGHRSVRLPWSVVMNERLFDNVLPVRLALYASLAAAVMVALWTAAQRRGFWRWALPGLAVVALVPNPWAGVWATTFTVPSFFTSSAYRNCLAPGENILPLPAAQRGNALLWQAANGFHFTMAGGNLGLGTPKPFLTPPLVARIAEGRPVPSAQIAGFARIKHVSSVIVDEAETGLWAPALDRLAARRDVGGILLYRLSGPARPCPG